jgi:LysM repeat protein
MASGTISSRAPAFRKVAAAAAGLAISCCVAAAPALASTSHVVAAGETLSGIAAANGLSTESLAAWNGLAADHLVISGSTIVVPTPEEAGTGAAATSIAASAGTHVVGYGETLTSIADANDVYTADLAAANGLAETDLLIEGTSLAIPAAVSAAPSASPAVGLGAIWSPWGDLYLDPAAADAWNAMRDASLAQYGQDLYPAGPLSAYRTAEQQGELYDLFLSGAGAPANPPGSSSHESGLSVDLASEEMLTVVDQIGWQYGWGRFEAPDEWWHVTYGG